MKTISKLKNQDLVLISFSVISAIFSLLNTLQYFCKRHLYQLIYGYAYYYTWEAPQTRDIFMGILDILPVILLVICVFRYAGALTKSIKFLFLLTNFVYVIPYCYPYFELMGMLMIFFHIFPIIMLFTTENRNTQYIFKIFSLVALSSFLFLNIILLILSNGQIELVDYYNDHHYRIAKSISGMNYLVPITFYSTVIRFIILGWKKPTVAPKKPTTRTKPDIEDIEISLEKLRDALIAGDIDEEEYQLRRANLLDKL